MADHVQLEIFNLSAYTSGNLTSDIRVVVQMPERTQDAGGKQLELVLFPDLPAENYSSMKRAA